MANIIPPKTPFEVFDPHNHFRDDATWNESTFLSLSNIGAVVAAEHLRSMGYRGVHMVALIVLAATAVNHLPRGRKQAALDVLKLVEPERDAWGEDLLEPEKWDTARALCATFGDRTRPAEALPTLTEAVMIPDYLPVSVIVASYSTAVVRVSSILSERPAPTTNDLVGCIGLAFGSLAKLPENTAFARVLVSLFHKFLTNGGGTMSLEEAWAFAREPFAVPKHEVRVGDTSDPEATKKRRMENGAGGAAVLLKAFTSQVGRQIDLMAAPSSPMFAGVRSVGLLPLLRGDLSQVYCSTFMRREAYEKFLTDGVYQDVWSRGVSWHNRYHDRPLVARSFHEMRLFGERGDGVTYGYITTCDAWQDEVARSATRDYGDVEVYWRPDKVLPFATATLEDSMRSHIVIDANDAASLTYVVLACLPDSSWAVHSSLRMFSRRLRSLNTPTGRFIEFQCHGPLTPDDVESVVMHDLKGGEA